MAGYLACRDAQRIAAVALVVAPTFGQDDGPCAPSQPVSILDIRSVDDPLVPYAGQPATAGGFAQPAVLDWLAGWARLDHCQPDAPSGTVTQAEASTTWTHCDASATVTGYAVHTGHGWPDLVSDTPTAQVVWAFLNAHRRS
jgi:polyhydroxybutyrate depolymerase